MLFRSRLRSSTSIQLVVNSARHIDERSFSSAGPRLCGGLPDNITAASSLLDFRRKLRASFFLGNHIRIMFLVTVDLEVVSYAILKKSHAM